MRRVGAVLGNVLKSDLVVGHLVDCTGVADRGLDAETVDRVLNDVVVKGNSVNNVRRTATNGSNRQSVTTGAKTVLESDALEMKLASGVELKEGGLAVPELTATQSSWLYTFAPSMTTLELVPMSKPSVL